ncbi:hypothetical protein MtrunA17_Chr3g0122811 [Medicago truncatula]|uniref:Transmembrane protein n=1 Tax=Medicago truncatula TaxID=3880 RepID=A0A396IYT3_MEDTR|nr:hypothetical protein MtrunA17_Chr3g0122811 [Medicago truncatula]
MKFLLLHCHFVFVLIYCQTNLQLLLPLHLPSAVSMSLPLFLPFEHSWSFYLFFSQIVLLLYT